MGLISGLRRGYRAFSRQFDEATEGIGGCIGWVIPWSIVALIVAGIFTAIWREYRTSRAQARAQVTARAERPSNDPSKVKSSPPQKTRLPGKEIQQQTREPSEPAETAALVTTDAPTTLEAQTPVSTPNSAPASTETPTGPTDAASDTDTSQTIRPLTTFGVKYNTGVYGYPRLTDGSFYITDSLIEFRSSGGVDSFAVKPGKILDVRMVEELGKPARLVVRVAVKNSSANRERRVRLDFYHPDARVVNRGRGNVDLNLIECSGCDASLHTLHVTLDAARRTGK